ncbi:helix-turn-helix transcriptional regulator [Magnetococcus sp. PR-3]|uniref:helix-turn-helix transcriptional regulator n=1 Tax=Magnetococcus sp. PR-3 TaxID=3120355 RepID=UPI002FCE5CBB
MLGNHGNSLLALTQSHAPFAQVAKALELIHQSYAENISVERLAKEAGMSVSAFHRAFKHVTAHPPLQYLRRIRLNNAKNLMAQHGMRVSHAATEVGYERVFQFSREFKRHFNRPPTRAAEIGYAKRSS